MNPVQSGDISLTLHEEIQPRVLRAESISRSLESALQKTEHVGAVWAISNELGEVLALLKGDDE